MSHSPHEGPDDAVLFDGCQECDERAADPLAGLLSLDARSFAVLADRMRDVEYGGRGSYRTGNEASLGRALYRLTVLLERHPGVLT